MKLLAIFVVAACVIAAVGVDAIEGLVISSARLVGGKFISQEYFPYLVSIQKASHHHKVWFHYCGGSIVSESWVLTACHCVASTHSHPLVYKDVSELRIVAGVTDLKAKTPSRQERRIEMAVAHEKCRRVHGYTYYDVGLMKLNSPLKFNYRVQPLELVSRNKTAAAAELRRLQKMHYECDSPGWGRVKQVPKVVRSTSLKVGNQKLKTAAECHQKLCPHHHQRYKERMCSNMDRIEQFCVTSKTSSVCNGDSGGPLVCNGFVFGTVSGGNYRCKYGGMQIFSDIRSILSMVNKLVSE